MKKLILISLVFGCAGLVHAVTQPLNIGNVKCDGIAIPSYTLAQMNALTSDTTGQLIYVSDALQSAICVSSGTTAPGQWTVPTATSTAVIGGLIGHCK